MMTSLFDQEKIFKIYVEEEKAKAAKEATERAETAEKAAMEAAERAEKNVYAAIFALKDKLSAEEIASAFKLPLPKVLDILTSGPSPAST